EAIGQYPGVVGVISLSRKIVRVESREDFPLVDRNARSIGDARQRRLDKETLPSHEATPQFQCCFEFVDRLGQLSGNQVAASQASMRKGEIWIERNRLLVQPHCVNFAPDVISVLR